jgi:flagellar brake protein
MALDSDGQIDGFISNPLEIGGLLRSLAQRLDILNANYVQWHVPTRILDVDIAARTFIFDRNTNFIAEETALNADAWFFHATPNGIRMEFSVGRVQPVVFEENPGFQSRFPAILLWRQRREYFRVQTPVLDPYICSGSLNNGKRFRAEVFDLSLSGVALRTADDQLLDLVKGSIVRDAEIHFPGRSSISLHLELVSQRELNGVAGKSNFILGFKFLSLPCNTDNVLQRLIVKLKLERN